MNSERYFEIPATKVAPFILQDEIYQQDEHLYERWIGRRGFQE